MLGYIVRRLLWIIPVLLLVSIITFALMPAAPGGPWAREKQLATAQVERLNAIYGLDQPIWQQYLRWASSRGILARRTSTSTSLSTTSWPMASAVVARLRPDQLVRFASRPLKLGPSRTAMRSGGDRAGKRRSSAGGNRGLWRRCWFGRLA